MRVYVNSNAKLVLVVAKDLANFEYYGASHTIDHAIQACRRAIKRTSTECYVHLRIHDTDDDKPQD